MPGSDKALVKCYEPALPEGSRADKVAIGGRGGGGKWGGLKYRLRGYLERGVGKTWREGVGGNGLSIRVIFVAD